MDKLTTTISISGTFNDKIASYIFIIPNIKQGTINKWI